MTALAAAETTSRLVDYILAAKPADLPNTVRREALRSFFNIYACTIGGSRHEAVEIAERALMPFAGAPQATIIGRGARTDGLTACLINCLSSSVYTYDDTHAEAIVHPSGPIMAAVLVLAERRPISGRDLLLAFALGVETVCRLSKAISVAPARGSIAWSQTGITCGIGTAIAAGKLLNLDAQALRRAIGIAASQAAGIRAMHGSMCTPMMPAHASQMGLRAAILAEAQFTSSERSIEARYGFAECFAEAPNLAAATDGLGERFELLANTYKPYPCGIVIHPMIDACLQLKAEHGLDAAHVERIRIAANPAALALTDRRHPKDEFEGQVSLYHWVAASLVRGRAGVAECVEACIKDPTIAALRDRITATSDASIAADSADVAVTLRDGRTLELKVRHGIGSRDRPMTDGELEAKFRGLAEGVVAPDALPKLIDLCWQLEALPDAAALVRAAA
jgi:2-methylcitrate dehydratase PrpD